MMDITAFNEYLENRYKGQLAHYSGASAKNKKRYNNFQWILIVLSTLTTILAALSPIGKFDTHYAVVVTAGLVAILTSGMKTFQYQELWVNNRSTVEQLKPEIYYYQFNVGDYGRPGIDKETLFVSRVEQILTKEHDSWPMLKKVKEKELNEDLPEDAQNNIKDDQA